MKSYNYFETLDSHYCSIFHINVTKNQITLYGWRPDHQKFKPGQKILLKTKGGVYTRYQIKAIRRPGNPSNQYFMDCVFDPRTNEEIEGDWSGDGDGSGSGNED